MFVYEGAPCSKLFKAWNILVRQTFHLIKKTHRYLIEAISNKTHLMTMLFTWLYKFNENLRKSPKFIIRYLSAFCQDDLRTCLGRNLLLINEKTNFSQPGVTL